MRVNLTKKEIINSVFMQLGFSKKMSESINNSQLEVLKECGHMIIFEKAFEMREIVKNFVQKNHK